MLSGVHPLSDTSASYSLPSYKFFNLVVDFRSCLYCSLGLAGPAVCDRFSIGLKKNLSAVCSLSIVWGSRIAVACSAVCFIAAIRVYYAPTSPCSGCSLSWCSHLPPSRHCFTWAHAISPNYDGWPQAPVIRRADLLHRLRQTRQFLLRCHASSCFLFSCVFMPALLLWLYRQWLSVLPFRP